MDKPSLVCLFARELGLWNLRGILEDGAFEVKAVVTHYYEPGGPKIPRPMFNAFVDISENSGLPLIVVDKNQEKLKILEHMEFDFLIANCYKYIIPDKINALARIAALNMHRSLLPKYKGLKPLERALANNETKTGTSIHKMTPKIDSGDIVDQYEIPIEPGDDVAALFQKLYPIQYPLMKRAILKLFR
jgi:methionyl-tRNA formyltransferase